MGAGRRRGRLAGPLEQPVDPLVLDRERQLRGTERQVELDGGDDGAQQLAVRPGEDGPRRVVRGPGTHGARHPHDVVRAVGREDEAARGRGPGHDPLREPLGVVLDEPHGALDDRPRAAVVGLEVDPAQPRERRGQPEDPAHVGEAPAVDRLVVVAHEEHVVRRGREEQRELELGPVEVLRLVHEQVPAAAPPALEDVGGGVEQPHGADDQVVEVDAAAVCDRALVGDVGPGDRPGRRVRGDLVRGDPQVELEPREGEVEARAIRRARGREQLAQQLVAIDQRVDRDARLGQQLAAEGMERPHADGPRRPSEGLERRVEPGGELLGGALVERHDGDPAGIPPAVDEPGHARHERRRLAASRGRDAQDRAGRRRRGGPLVGREPGEPLDDGRVPDSLHVAARLTRAAYAALCASLAAQREGTIPEIAAERRDS